MGKFAPALLGKFDPAFTWTCGGASDAFALMLALITQRFGKAEAFVASSMFMHDHQSSPGDVPDDLLRVARAGSMRLRKVIDLMVETVDNPPSLSSLAGKGGMSVSKLDRLFRADTGMSPGAFFRMLRLARAQDLVSGTTLSLNDIALRCGYCDAAALSKSFRGVYGHPIGRARYSCTGNPSCDLKIVPSDTG